MPIDVACRQVFLASPGGLSAERKLSRKVFRQHNESRAVDYRIFFYVHFWEDVAGGVGRPQDRINPNLDECDYLVMLFNDKWGTPPAISGPYTSGTEEEFFRALELLADSDRPMRDILVLFKAVDPARMVDPGPELQRVMDFRARLEESKSLMYETFDSDERLRRSLDRKLRDWLKDDEPKQPRRIVIPETTVDTSGLRSRDREELVESARTFAGNGLLMQAEAAYAAATQGGEPELLLEFGRFMRRTGRLEQAMALNYRIVEDSQLLVTRSAKASGLRVRAMSNIGVIQRDLGELTESIRILQEAVQTAETSREPIPVDECYALDNYGWTLMRADQPDLALKQFQRVDRIRAEFGTVDQRVQSAINLGRYLLTQGRLTDATDYFSRALKDLQVDSDQHLRANALAGTAEALIRLGREQEADELLRQALEVNQGLNNKKGQSIVHGLWARSFLQQDRSPEADPHISAARELTDETGDAQGRAVVAWLRAEAARRRGDLSGARALLADAEQVFAEATDATLRRDVLILREALQEI